jgi:hypothetical protein
VVTAILAGPGALARRIGGRLGAGLEALANRLREGDDRRPARVSFAVVKRIGSAVGGFGALRLDGLLVGRRAVGARLGYDRGKMKGPLPVKLLAGWLFHDGRYVEWGRIRTIEPDRILISGTVEDLPRPGPSS